MVAAQLIVAAATVPGFGQSFHLSTFGALVAVLGVVVGCNDTTKETETP
jgi:ribosome biogenesis protein Tsr3